MKKTLLSVVDVMLTLLFLVLVTVPANAYLNKPINGPDASPIDWTYLGPYSKKMNDNVMSAKEFNKAIKYVANDHDKTYIVYWESTSVNEYVKQRDFRIDYCRADKRCSWGMSNLHSGPDAKGHMRALYGYNIDGHYVQSTVAERVAGKILTVKDDPFGGHKN